MADISVEAPLTAGQEERHLGEFTERFVRLTLHANAAATFVRRHRVTAAHDPDVVATVAHESGAVTNIAWDEQHRGNDQPWRARAEQWIAAKIAADWADQAGRR